MAHVTILNNPDALHTWAVRDLLTRAFPPGNPLHPEGFEADPTPFERYFKKLNYGIIIGQHEGELCALSIIWLPSTKYDGPPQIMYFYNHGPNELRRMLVDATVDFVRDKGHVKLLAINRTGRPDSVWARTYRRAGTVTRLGGLMEVSFERDIRGR